MEPARTAETKKVIKKQLICRSCIFVVVIKTVKASLLREKKSIKIKIYTNRKKLYILKNGRIKKELNL